MHRKAITNLVSSILIFTIVTCSISIVYVTVCMNDKSIFGYRIFMVLSGSMEKTLQPNDIILTEKVPEDQLHVEDIISFISDSPDIEGQVNTHRIVRIDGDNFYTKGDANYYQDSLPTNFSNVIGKVIWHSSFIGKIISWVKMPRNMLILIAVTLIFAFFDVGKAVNKIIGAFRRKKRGEMGVRKRVFVEGKRKLVLGITNND